MKNKSKSRYPSIDVEHASEICDPLVGKVVVVLANRVGPCEIYYRDLIMERKLGVGFVVVDLSQKYTLTFPTGK